MKTRITILTLLLAVVITGCQQKSTSTSSSSSTSTATTGSTSGSGSGATGGGSTTGYTGGTSGGGYGASCTGTAQDGTGPGSNLWQYDILMAGHQKFYPSNHYGSEWGLMNLNEGKIAFQSDYRLKVRLRIRPQPVAPPGQEYCYGRQIGQVTDAVRYNKVKFTVYLRDVLEHNTTKALVLGSRYQRRDIDPVTVDGCSPVIDYSNNRNTSSSNPNYTVVSHVIEIDDVRSDSNCEACKTKTTCAPESYYCPVESIVRAASCWRMTLQISTDYTQDFM